MSQAMQSITQVLPSRPRLHELKPCMGGWCRIRERCGNYHSTAHDALGKPVPPVERICDCGHDGFNRVLVVWVQEAVRLGAH